MTDTTVLIPAFNEAQRVGAVIKVCLEANLPVVVVSDGSSDGTVAAAENAGAKVINLPENKGKGASLFAGLEHISTPFTLMLDADLVGLTPAHLLDMIEPVRNGKTGMTIGIFRSGGLLTDFGNRATPHLSGQRMASTSWFLEVPGLSQRWPEPAITEHLKTTGTTWEYVPLEGAGQIMKEMKRGLLKGMFARFEMYRHILTNKKKLG